MKQEQELSEGAVQQGYIRWYRNTHCLVHHHPRCLIVSVPNEGDRNPHLIATGLLPGASDVIVFHRAIGKPMRILFIETKRPDKSSKQNPAQKRFEAHIKAMGLEGENVEYHVVRSEEEFKRIILNP